MSVYLSPGVYPREVDLSLLPAGIGALRPVFIGAAKKGPINEPTLVTSAQQFVDIFGEPFSDSYLGYAVIAFFNEGASCYVLRVGVEYEDGMDSDLAAIAIDTAGTKIEGWGRIPVFTGIDYGEIEFREVGDGTGSNADPVVIHDAGVVGAVAGVLTGAFTDSSGGTADADVTFTSEAYSGCLDEVYTLTITDAPTATNPIDGATYIVTDSSGDTVASGTISDVVTGTVDQSDTITLTGLGISFYITMNSGSLGVGDTIVFSVRPDNTQVVVTVEGVSETITLATGTYDSATEMITAINDQSPSDYDAVVVENSDGDDVPAIRTDTAGDWIQITGSCAFCTEVGVDQYSYDIPRSYLIGNEEGPYSIGSSNNDVVMDVIGADETIRFDFSLPTIASASATSIANVIDSNATYNGTTYFESFALMIPGGTSHVVIVTSKTRQYDQLQLQATYSFLACLRFADEIGISYPYTLMYRSFWDSRVELPTASSTTPSSPASCDADPTSTQCTLDTAYFQNIVGWIVAKYPGTWVDDYTVTLEVNTGGVGDVAGRYKITVKDSNGLNVDLVDDVSFDSTDTRYIANLVNEGSTLGGVNGNDYYSWEARPSTLTGTRNPSPFSARSFSGGANGIPTSAADSGELDNAVIGNPSLSTGIYAFQNPESYDFNLLVTPGFTSGPVIAQAIQFCESRGDVLYLVDPPYGLKPQQVIDWHNGMLVSDLASAIDTSYGALYWSWVKINDLFGGGTIWVPPSGYVASVFAKTSNETEQWFAPAGINRGQLPSVLDIEYNPTQGERDALYGSGNAVNAIVDFVQQGITVWGQRTLQRQSTALDRVNVRMLMIFLKKNLQRTLRSFVFEQNDAATRAQVRSVINPFLADVASRRGLTAYSVVCDESNNTPERIDRNELHVAAFVKPTQVAEFIVLNLVILKTGANFDAAEVLAAGGIVT